MCRNVQVDPQLGFKILWCCSGLGKWPVENTASLLGVWQNSVQPSFIQRGGNVFLFAIL